MGNLSLLAQELGNRDKDLGQFVNSSAAVFRRFTAQNDKLGETLALLPNALKKTNVALGKLDTMSTTFKTGLRDLAPGVKALGPTLRDTRPFFKDTTPVLRDSIRPFAREAQPSAAKLIPAARHLAKATPDLDHADQDVERPHGGVRPRPAGQRRPRQQLPVLRAVGRSQHQLGDGISGRHEPSAPHAGAVPLPVPAGFWTRRRRTSRPTQRWRRRCSSSTCPSQAPAGRV